MTMLDRLRPQRTTGEDGVALLMVLAYIAIFTSLMLAMLAIVIGQVKPTAQARKDVGSVNAAASGLQVALTTMRTATDTLADGSAGAGNRGRLPCEPGGTTRFTEGGVTKSTPGAKTRGVASDLPGNFTYEYNVAYYLLDPTDKDPVWLASNAMACPSGKLPKTPLYAYVQSYGVGDALVTGTADRGNRSQTGIYKFSVPTENIAGGQIRPRQKRSLCWDAGPTPDLGSRLKLKPCDDPATAQQLFEYRTDLTLFYGGNPSLNLCIQGSDSEIPNLQRCTGVGSGNTFPYSAGQREQSWSYNNNGAFSAGDVNGNADNSKCVGPVNLNDGANIRWGGYCGTQLDPEPAVGAGKAGGNTTGSPGAPTQQYVNFLQFGRCLDVTSGNFDKNYLIAYPCKQAPNSDTLSWNQLWQFTPVTGKTGAFFTTPRSGNNQNGVTPGSYKDKQVCLTAVTSSIYVRGKLCQSPLPPEQQWTANGLVPGSPQTSYQLVSKLTGKCMSLSEDDDLHDGNYRKMTLKPCAGALGQRWNAPPPPPVSGLDAIREGTSVRELN